MKTCFLLNEKSGQTNHTHAKLFYGFQNGWQARRHSQCHQHLMKKVTRSSRARIAYNQSFTFRKYHCPETTAHNHSANANLPESTLAPTISIPLSAFVLKCTLWRTEFVATHKGKMSLHGKFSAENNLSRVLDWGKYFKILQKFDPLDKGP